MKYSILIALLILGIASFFGFGRQQKIATLTTELETLVKQGEEFDVPADPAASFSPRRFVQRVHKQEREEMINKFIGELMELIKESQQPNRQSDPDFQKRGIEMISTMLELSSAELKLMVLRVAESDSLNLEEKQQLSMFAVMMLADNNPDTALTLILETHESNLLEGPMSRQMLSTALGSLAKTDPVAAAEWLKEHGEKVGGVQDELTRIIIVQAGRENIGLALDLIKGLEETGRGAAYASLGLGITPERIDEFFNAIRGDDASDTEKASAFTSLAAGPFTKDPKAAIEWLDKSDLSKAEKSSFMQGLHYHQIKDNPETWMNWILKQEADPDLSKQGLLPANNIIRAWTQNDFVAAGEWVGKLPAGEKRNQAIVSYAGTLSRHEPAAAEEWAVSLPEGSQRTELLEKILHNLTSNHKEAAVEFAERHGITPPKLPEE